MFGWSGDPAWRRACLPLLVALAVVGSALPALSPAAVRPPLPEPNAAINLLPRPCALESRDRYEAAFYKAEGWKGPDYERYPGACQRLRFSFGPIVVKPGQNDVLVEPVVIDKPLRSGYITRFRPDLVLADGTVPPIEQLHLHHATWLSAPEYGSGPFFAAGEEKTIAPFPKGYGMPVKATDTWLLLYMVHSQITQPTIAYITYDVDFVPERKAEALGIKPAYPIWLDVRPSAYPVFNVQRGFGSRAGECTWPKERCAGFDPWGKKIEGQGEPGNGAGTDFTLPARGERLGHIADFTGGTLIGIGGHLHPGGLRNEVDLVRNGKSRRIYTNKAAYWDRRHPGQPGGPPTSWDFSARVTGLPKWGVHVKPGDVLRSNATYDTRIQSTYENMGIVVTMMAPDTPSGKPTARGIDPFKARRDSSARCRSGGLLAAHPTLCDKGIVTHGHLAEASNYGDPAGKLAARPGLPTNQIAVGGFQYLPGDLSTASLTGVPRVRLGNSLQFTNLEGAAVWHTITSCAYPCMGSTGIAFPLGDGSTNDGRPVDFDSGQLGIGTPAIGPSKQTLTWKLPVTRQAGYRPGEVVTYYCRVHPFMRGAFEVTR
jgi:hypothetical protein